LADARTAGRLGAGEHGLATDLAVPAASRTTTTLRWALAAAVGSRLLLFLFVALTAPLPSEATRKTVFVGSVARLFPDGGVLERAFFPWARWDGMWFAGIAEHGYSWPWSEAFYPLYPFSMRQAAHVFDGNYVVAGVVVSLLCFLGAIILLYRLVALDFSRSVALWTTVFLAVFPTSFFFQAVYSESLFLLLTVACLSCARQGRWALAGLIGLAAALTRSTGLYLLVPMAVFYLQERDWKVRRIDLRAGWLFLVPTGFVIWMGYLWLRMGDPLLALRAEGHWNRHLTFPAVTLWRGIVDFSGHFDRTVVDGRWGTSGVHDLLALVVVVGMVAMIWVGWRRLPPAYTAYAIVAVFVPLCFPALHRPLFSLPRFALVVFPVFVTLALLTEPKRRDGLALQARFWVRWALAAAFMAGACGLAYLFARHVFVS
jgi:hypothetical protein